MKTKTLFIFILLLSMCSYGFAAQQTLETTINPAYNLPAETIQGGDVEDTINANMVKQEANNSDLYSQAATKWLADIGYTTDNTFVAHGGQLYICKEGHLSSVTTEPGVGATWETGWTLFSGSSQTGAEIKAAYEAEADTNAYTNAEKTLLGQQSGTNTGDQDISGKQDDLDVPSQAEAEAGTSTTERVWTAQRIAQEIAALASGGVDEIVYQADCTNPAVTNGICIDNSGENIGLMYYWNGTALIGPEVVSPDVETLMGATDFADFKDLLGVEIGVDVVAPNQDTSGNAATASALETARTIGGVSFNGTANINLPGVNATGDQDTSGNAATATTANAGDSATAFFPSGTIEDARIAATLTRGPSGLVLYLEDDCTTVSSPVTGAICFEY